MILDDGTPSFSTSSRDHPIGDPLQIPNRHLRRRRRGRRRRRQNLRQRVHGRGSRFRHASPMSRCTAAEAEPIQPAPVTSSPPPDPLPAAVRSSNYPPAASPLSLPPCPPCRRSQVIPSLTFFPAALPIALPAAEAPTSVIVCAPASPAASTNKIPRIQYLIWQRSTPYGVNLQAKHLMAVLKIPQHHLNVVMYNGTGPYDRLLY